MSSRQRTVEIDIDGITLSGAFFSPGGPGNHPVVIVCHGMPAGPSPPADAPPDPDDGITYADFATVCAERGLATLIFNFRGTGASGGNLHAMGWASDLRAIVEWVSQQPGVRTDRIGTLGSSMGASVALHVAATEPRLSSVVSFAAPARMGASNDAMAMVQRMRDMGVIRDSDFPPSAEDWYAEFGELDPLLAIPAISPRRVVLLQGDADDVVSPEDAGLLFDEAGDPKNLVMLPGVGHRFRREPAAIEACLDWLETTLLD